MALTSEELERILVESTTGQKPSLKSKEALDARKRMDADVESIREKGGMIDIPADH